MTDKYWVGSAGNWSDTNHWSLTSGGAVGATVPEIDDNVFIDSSSGSGPFTISVDIDTELLNNIIINYPDYVTIEIETTTFQWIGLLRQFNGKIYCFNTGHIHSASGSIAEFWGKLEVTANATFDGNLTFESTSSWYLVLDSNFIINADLSVNASADVRHGNSTVIAQGDVDQSFAINQSLAIFRLNNSNVGGDVKFVTYGTKLDAIYFNENTKTVADVITVYLDGKTKNLGDAPYQSRADLLANGYIEETNGGLWVFSTFVYVTKYWVGSAGNWSDKTHWSLTSGGPSGESMPELDEDVVIDSLSGIGTFNLMVDVDTGLVRNIWIDYQDIVQIRIQAPTFEWYGRLDQFNGKIHSSVTGLIQSASGSTAFFWGELRNGNSLFNGDLTFESTGSWVFGVVNNAIINADLSIHASTTITHTDSTVTVQGTGDQSLAINQNHGIYRLDNLNVDGDVKFVTYPTKLDGIFFNENTKTVADVSLVTLDGLTPSLGQTPFHSRQDLLDNGYIEEINGGLFQFDNDFKYHHGWNILYGLNASVQNEYIKNIEVEKGINYLPSWARIELIDPDRSFIASYPRGCQITIHYHDGTEWMQFFKCFVLDIKTTGKVGGITELYCPGYDWFLTAKISIDFTYRTHTIARMLEHIINFFTPFTWNINKIDLKTGGNTAALLFDGDTVANAIVLLLSYSDDEEFGVDIDRDFFIQQRATSHDGTRDAAKNPGDGNLVLYSVKDDTKQGFNLLHFMYDESTTRRGRYKWDFAGTIEPFDTQLGLAHWPSIPDFVVEPNVNDDDYLLVQELVKTMYDLREPETIISTNALTGFEDVDPGEVCELTIDEIGYTSVAKKISRMRLNLHTWQAQIDLSDPTKMISKSMSRGMLLQMYQRQAKMEITSEDFCMWNLLSFVFDTQTQFNEFSFYSTGASHASGYVYCTGATTGLEKIADVILLQWPAGTGSYPYALETNYSNYRYLMTLQQTLTQNDGQVSIWFKRTADVSSTYIPEYKDLRGDWEMINTNVHVEIWMEWDGVGVSPQCSFLRIPVCAWDV